MLLSCGDALIDFVPEKAADGRDAFVPVVGGSCLNIAVAMARLGPPTGFVGGVSTDIEVKAKIQYDRTADQITWIALGLVEDRAIGTLRDHAHGLALDEAQVAQALGDAVHRLRAFHGHNHGGGATGQFG